MYFVFIQMTCNFFISANFIGNQDAAIRDTSIPQVVQALTGNIIEDIDAGAEFILALDRTENLWSWGINTEGQLGVGNINPQYVPCFVSKLTAKQINRISAGKT